MKQPHEQIACVPFLDMNNRELMLEAIKEAESALEENEVPVGAVVAYQSQIIGRGHNQRNKNQQVSHHAEMLAISQACDYMKCWHLDNCSIYVTMEPCPMCAGTIMQSRIEHVFYGVADDKAGSFGSVFDLSIIQGFNHYPIIHAGVMEEECKRPVEEFFNRMRKENKKI